MPILRRSAYSNAARQWLECRRDSNLAYTLRAWCAVRDPTLIHLSLDLIRNGKSAKPQFRARYVDGRIILFDPIPSDAIPVN